MVNNKISLSPVPVALALGVVAFVLMLASVAGQLAPYFTSRSEPVFFLSVDAEQNLPTFFSILLLLIATALLAIIALFKKVQGASYAVYWAILSVGFLLMAVDEATSIHEKLHEPMSRLLGDDRPAVFYFAWVVPAIVFVFVAGLFFLKFLLRLPAKTRFLFFLAGFLYVGGAIVLELIGSLFAFTYGLRSWTLIVSYHVEECLEMAGVIIFIFALLRYLADVYGELRFGFDSPGVRQSSTHKAPAVPLNLHATAPQPPRSDT